jgi:hypothetical protein
MFNQLNYAKSALAMTGTLSQWASWLKSRLFIGLEGWNPYHVRLVAEQKLKAA